MARGLQNKQRKTLEQMGFRTAKLERRVRRENKLKLRNNKRRGW